MPKLAHLTSAAAIFAAATTANAQTAEAIFTGIPGSPTNNLPGNNGTFNDSTSSQTAFDRPFLSPDGTFFGVKVDREISGTFFDDAIIVAPLANPSAASVIVEGEPAPGFSDGSLTVSFDRQLSIRDNGGFAFTGQRRLGSVSQGDDLVYGFDAVTQQLSVLATAGDSFGGSTLSGGGINSPYLAPTGGLGLQGSLEDVADFGGAVVFEGTTYQEVGTTPPGAPAATEFFEFQTTFFGNNGQSYLTQARAGTIDTVVVNGQGVIVGGQPLPGSGFTSPVSNGAVSTAAMIEDGTWFARGSNADGTEWVVIDGTLIATEGDAVAGGSAIWTDFDGITVDGNGNFVIIGDTSDGDLVAVYNNTDVLITSGDPVNVDGSAAEYVLRDFSIDDAVLSSTGELLFAGRLRTVGGANAGQALMTIAVPEPASLGLLAAAGLALVRRR